MPRGTIVKFKSIERETQKDVKIPPPISANGIENANICIELTTKNIKHSPPVSWNNQRIRYCVSCATDSASSSVSTIVRNDSFMSSKI